MHSNAIDLRKMTIPEEFCDCRFFCFRALLSLYGYFPSEEDMLGLGDGLSLQLLNVSPLSTKIYCPIGRVMNFEADYGERVGIGITGAQFTPDRILSQIREKIDAGDPIIANVDRYYLPYLSIQRAHVGYHTVLVFGYDDESQTLKLLDGLTGPEVIDLPYDTFEKAVLSDCPIPTNRLWYFLDRGRCVPEKQTTEKEIAGLLRNTCRRVLAETESAGGFVTAMKGYLNAGAASPQIRKFLDVQSNVFFPCFHEQERYRAFYRKTFFAFVKNHLSVFPEAFHAGLLETGEAWLASIDKVNEARLRDAAEALLAFDAYLGREEAMHRLLLDALKEGQDTAA